ncbi:hypothetical protein NLJ89_g1661 [Agrocybe chaxingu]|uniref:Nephrocystin 3-like N-terminal domain-containing protein n=1 Tax=Agrocybe chaxingu TaxID=84603 RepID=A0A9W8TD27_9AGAR|nr:hypothetical protein NLJ89_g1661 [Agrocybe chaxingu]
MFTHSSEVVVTHSHLSSVNYHSQGQSAFEKLHASIAEGAMHDSSERYDPPKCHPGTRQTVLKKLFDWILDHQDTFIHWLYGPAGAGKSAIMQTLALQLHEKGLLIATFFFSRTIAAQSNEKRLVATIAYQLAVAIPSTRPHIQKAIELDPAVLLKSLETQFQQLVITPLNRVIDEGRLLPPEPTVILIDGLDECNDSAVQRYILTCLAAIPERCKFPLGFVAASRPELPLIRAFSTEFILPSVQHSFRWTTPFPSIDNRNVRDGIILDPPSIADRLVRTDLEDTVLEATGDIRKFLEAKFKEIRDHHPLRAYIPIFWPSSDVIDTLVRKSSGQFIFASTVARYISHPQSHPHRRLETILSLSPICPNEPSPFVELDALYSHIFQVLQPDVQELALQILGLLLFHNDSGRLFTRNINEIEDFLRLQEGTVIEVLSGLVAVIKTDGLGEIRFLHASMEDFLLSKGRSGKFHISRPKLGELYARMCLQYFTHGKSSKIYERSIHFLSAYCRYAMATVTLQRDFLTLDIDAIGRRSSDLARHEHTRHIFLRKDILLFILQIYQYCSAMLKVENSVDFMAKCQAVVETFIRNQLEVYRSRDPLILRLLLAYVAEGKDSRLIDQSLMPGTSYSGETDFKYTLRSMADQLFAPLGPVPFVSKQVSDADATSLFLSVRFSEYWKKNPPINYIGIAEKHLTSDDFSNVAWHTAAYITSTHATWFLATTQDHQRLKDNLCDGRCLQVGTHCTCITPPDGDVGDPCEKFHYCHVLQLKHQAYEAYEDHYTEHLDLEEPVVKDTTVTGV